MPRASSRSSDRLVWSSSWARSSSVASSGSPPARRARGAEQEGQRHEPRLRAVVQVALQPPPLGVAGLDDPRARGAQLLQAGAQLGVELGHAAAQQAAQVGERRQPGGDERGPEGRVAGAGPSHGHEQEREQRADVDRRQLQAHEHARAAPALGRPHQDHEEEARVQGRAEREQRPGQVRRRPGRAGRWPGSPRSRARAARRRTARARWRAGRSGSRRPRARGRTGSGRAPTGSSGRDARRSCPTASRP